MEFSCDIKDLKRIVESLNFIATKAFNKIPVILVESSVRDQAIRLRSSYGLFSGRALLKEGVTVEKSGSACIVSVSMRAALNSMKYTDDKQVKVEIDDSGRFKLSSGDITYKYGLLPESHLSRFDEEKPVNIVKVDSEEFTDLISKTSFAGSSNIPIEIKFCNSKLHMTAIGMSRISTGSIETDSDVEDTLKVSLDSVQSFYKLTSSKSKLAIGWNSTQLMIKCDEFIFIAPLSDGHIPNYNAILQLTDNHKINLEVPKTELRQKLEAFQPLAVDKNYMKMRLSSDKIYLSLDNQDMGFVSRIVDCEYDGDEFLIFLNPRMTFEFCKNFTGGNWLIKMNEPSHPILIKSVEDEDCMFLQSPIG